MERENFDRFFPKDISDLQPSRELFESIKGNDFYAPALVETFLQEVDHNTIVIAVQRWRLERYAVAGKLNVCNYGYIFLEGSPYTSTLKLHITSWADWDKTSRSRLKDSLFDSEILFRHRNRVIISSDPQRHGGMEIPIPGHRRRLVVSDLRMEFYPERWSLAPADPNQSLDWWILTDFVPRFLNERVRPVANIPRREMELWVSLENQTEGSDLSDPGSE